MGFGTQGAFSWFVGISDNRRNILQLLAKRIVEKATLWDHGISVTTWWLVTYSIDPQIFFGLALRLLNEETT
jgi:hypothetical protein